jgi:Flp pilus assembly protein TadD
MTSAFRGFLLASLSVSVLFVGACASTGGNYSNQADAGRLDAILERAAREAKASGNKAETVVLLEKIYQRNPDDPAVATAFGQALREDEQLNKARQVLYPFTEGKNAYPDAVTELAMVQLALGQYKEAELTSRRAVELTPEIGRPYLALGTALDAQNYHEQAEVAFRKGIDKWKGDPAPIMNNLALNLASQNKLDQAIDMLKKAQEVSPGRVELERNMRIITTLKEDADDFYTKPKAEAKKQTAAPKDAPVKADIKTDTAKKDTVKKDDTKKDDVANKQLPAAKSAPKKEAVKKSTAPEKVEPAATKTNSRGSTQNFN